MKLDIDHVLFWMDAIRNSDVSNRTLESFWKGQIKSKLWLIQNLHPIILKEFDQKKVSVDICGGWVGVMASLMFQSDISISTINSIDIDPSCEKIANTMNKIEEIEGRFKAITIDMCRYYSNSDVVINTSCEHLTQSQYDLWLEKLTPESLIVLQSNNYDIPEHVRTAESLEIFSKQSRIDILWAGEYDLPLYKRFMIVGRIKGR